MNDMQNYRARIGLLLTLAYGSACALNAQGSSIAPTPPPAASSSPAADKDSDSITVLDKVTVSDVPIDQQVLPTVRPISSVLGDDTAIIDIPRSVSSVNKAWMDDRQVRNAMDFGQFSPGVYSAAQYGVPATPEIRGDLAQIYYNGQIGLFTRNGIFPSFNGVEAMDIVKGPGSVVYGPQGNGPGGYVNLVTKQPYFDRQHTEISTTLGYWASGHSYSNPEFTIDTGGPLTSKLAYRLSWLERLGDGYYINDKNETDDLYAALIYRASKNLKLDWWAQGYDERFNEVSGANRVTQQFIDHGTYIGGQVYTSNDFDGRYSFGPVYNPALPGTPFNPAAPGSFPAPSLQGLSLIHFNPGSSNYDGILSVLDPATAYNVKLPSYDALLGPEDSAHARRFQSQLIATATVSPDLKIVNQTYFEDANSRKFETYGYDEYVPLMESFQDRLEFHLGFDTAAIGHSIVTGADFRYSRLVSYQDYSTEPFGVYDLYQPLKYVFYPAYYIEGKTFGGGLGIPGAPGYSGSANQNPGNQDSHIYDSGVFLQDNISLGKRFSAIVGTRLDYDRADTASPSFIFNYDIPFVNDTVFSGRPPALGTYLPKGTYYATSASANDPSYFASLVFKATDARSFYVSYNRTEAVLGATNFGGVDISGRNSNSAALANDLKTGSTLYEAGYKESFLSNTLYFGASVYQQEKSEPQLVGPAVKFRSDGLELEAVYQPTKALTVNANFTYQSVTVFAPSAFEQTLNYLDLYPVGFTVDGKSGTGIGSPNLGATNGFAYHIPGSRMKAPGVPQVLANFFVQYEFPSHFGFGVGPQIQGRQYANDQDTLHIPGEYELDGFVFYRRKTWDVRVNINNLTNNRILDPIDVSFAGNDTVYVRPPIAASLTVRYHF